MREREGIEIDVDRKEIGVEGYGEEEGGGTREEKMGE